MSDFKHKDNSGSLFRNEYKKDNEKAPDYKGSANVDGQEWSVAAWIKEGKGGKFMSMSFQPPRQKDEKPKAAPRPAMDDEPNDSIPFAWAFAIPLAGLLASVIYLAPLA